MSSPEDTPDTPSIKLPISYFEPQSEGKVTWYCGRDQNQRIISVFKFDNHGEIERRQEYVNVERAIHTRDELIKSGWKVNKAPTITTKIDGVEKPLNRKQKRYLARKLEREVRKKDFKEKE